jgi:hypothetical protein
MTIWTRLQTAITTLFSSKPLVYGYHGTSRNNANRILSQGFQFSENRYDWIGRGIYFFQDAEQRAWEWAEHRHANPAVLGALIELSNFIDLLDIGGFQLISEAYHLLIEEYIQIERPPPNQNPESGARWLDYAVINYAIEQLIELRFQTKVYGVRAAFAEGQPAFQNSALLDRTHVQIAVRDTSAIKHLFLANR